MNQYPNYIQPQAQPDISRWINDYMQKVTQQAMGQQSQPPQQAAQVPVFHCQPVKDLKEIEQMKWFNTTPFVGLTEDGQYVGIRRWDGTIPAATTEYFKRIKQEELPQPPRPVTHEELVELLPAVLAQYIPNLLNQMGVITNGRESASSASAIVTGELQTAPAQSKRAVGSKSSETSGDK